MREYNTYDTGFKQCTQTYFSRLRMRGVGGHPSGTPNKPPPLHLCGVRYLSDPVRLVLYPHHPLRTVFCIMFFVYRYVRRIRSDFAHGLVSGSGVVMDIFTVPSIVPLVLTRDLLASY